jgi:tetratricopeptide (TPR) repeat protein
MITRATGLAVLLVSSNAAAGPMEPDDLPPPRPEIVRGGTKIVLPAVPAFELPVIEPGFHRPRELRLRGGSLLGSEIAVKGYVTSIYDCADELALTNPRKNRAALLDAIDREPRLCDRPRFYLGDARASSIETSISVVEVPRKPAKPERESLSRGELNRWPVVPKLTLGERVVVTGTWATRSPHGEYNSEGLLVYKSLGHLAPEPPPPPGTTAEPTAVLAAAPEPEVTAPSGPPMRPLVANPVFNASVDHLNACNKLIVVARYTEAIGECEAALRPWPGNHLAWYEIASAHIAQRAWRDAAAAAERAVAMRPDLAMYQLYLGVARYEAELERVREIQAQRDHRPAEEIAVDPSLLELDAARDALVRATRLGPDLWRAHYYLGRLYRDRDDARQAAEQFTQAITANPSYRPAYVALIELYRRWDFHDQALAAARAGVPRVSRADARELWFEIGLVLHTKRLEDLALAAFDNALAGDPTDALSRFLRGQIYLKTNRLDDAEREFALVVRSTDPRVADAVPIAAALLEQLARKRKRSVSSALCQRYEGCPRDEDVGDRPANAGANPRR